MIVAAAAAISLASVDAPHGGRAFVIDSTLSYSRLVTSGEAIGCTTNGCPDGVYVTFSDRPGRRYPALRWRPFGTDQSPESVQALVVQRGELRALPVASMAATGDPVTLQPCANDSSSGFITSVPQRGERLSMNLHVDEGASGCPIIGSAGVVGVALSTAMGSALKLMPGPNKVAAEYTTLTAYSQPGYLTFDPRARAENNLRTGVYVDDPTYPLEGSYAVPAMRLCAAADRGDAAAAYGCGQAFLFGHGAPRDVDRALPYLRAAANAKVNDAAALVAKWEPIAAQFRQQFESHLAAANGGDAAAMLAVGKDYRGGVGTASDHVEYAYWVQRAVDAGNADARTELSFAYRAGDGVVEDDARALQLRQPATPGAGVAGANTATASTTAGNTVPQATAVQKTTTPARTTSQRSPAALAAAARALAASGDGPGAAKAWVTAGQTHDPAVEYEAAFFLTHTIVDGKSPSSWVPDGREVADEFFKDAADKGYLPAERMYVGMLERNLLQSDELTRWRKRVEADTLKAAQRGEPESEAALASMYLNGSRTLPVNCAESIKWARKAQADGVRSFGSDFGRWLAGYPSESACLGEPGALDFLKQSANDGDGTAIWRLGQLYYAGRFVPKDVNAAIALFRKGAAQHDSLCIDWLKAHNIAP
jgi:TPR repeat protein